MKRKKSITWCGLILFALVIVTLAIWPYQFVASPNFTLRIVDSNGQPLSGIRVTRELQTTQEQQPESAAVTDAKGEVNFSRLSVRMNLLKRIIKKLLIFLPGGQWEIYSTSDFSIYWPSGSGLRFDQSWKSINEVYENSDSIFIRDPALTQRNGYVELYFTNKRQDLTYTLVIYK